MKKSLGITTILCALVVSLLAAGPAAAKGSSNHLDLSFGQNGRALFQPGIQPPRWWATWPSRSAPTPDGGTVVTIESQGLLVARYDARGKLVADFGKNGFLAWDPGFTLSLKDVAVDASDRIVLVGTKLGVHPAATVLARLNPDGAPDQSFGGSGVVEPDLEIAPMAWEGSWGPPGSEPTGVAIDSAGRIVISGNVVRAPSICPEGSGFLARLTPAGGLDPSFAGDGALVFSGSALRSAGGVTLGTDGTVTTWSQAGRCKEPGTTAHFVRVTESGQPAPDFGTDGMVSTKEAEDGSSLVEAFAIDSRGRTISVRADRSIQRLLPNGKPDPSFGNGRGVTRLKLGGGEFEEVQPAAIAPAPDGSILVAGTQVEVARPDQSPAKTRYRLFLASLTASGKPRAGFGRNGILRFRPPSGTQAVGWDVRAVGNRGALVTGSIGNGESVVPRTGLFRFELGSGKPKARSGHS